jgi:protein SCO1
VRRLLAAGLLPWLACAGAAAAQTRVGQAPAETFTYDQRLNQPVPLDLEFTDEEGRAVQLGDYFRGRPVILALVQYRCPKLCGEVLNGLAQCLHELPARPGEDYEVVTVSFDPREDGVTVDDPQLGRVSLARAKKEAFVERCGVPGVGEHWHWLTGGRESIARLTEAVGFRYAYSEKDDRFAHGSGLVVLTSRGHNCQYFYGLVFHGDEMKRALDAARANKPGRLLKPVERVLLLCYDYDEETGTLKANVLKIVRTAGAATVLLLGGYLLLNWLRSGRGGGTKAVGQPSRLSGTGGTPVPPALASGSYGPASPNGVAHKGD